MSIIMSYSIILDCIFTERYGVKKIEVTNYYSNKYKHITYDVKILLTNEELCFNNVVTDDFNLFFLRENIIKDIIIKHFIYKRKEKLQKIIYNINGR